MATFNKQSRIGPTLHNDKDLYMENNNQQPKYISIDEHYFNMLLKEYAKAEMLKIEQRKKNNMFHSFFYIPTRIYNSLLYARSKISYI
jgi:hypothetical protein